MSSVDLTNVTVSYEGQSLPAINLIGKLQMQLQEAVCRIATIAATLENLQTALLNVTTIDVKLTLSKEDIDRFRSLGGMDDSERIRNVVMTLLHPEKADAFPSPLDSQPLATSGESRPVAPPGEFRPVIVKAAESAPPHDPETQPVERSLPEPPPLAVEPAIKKKPTTTCPSCQSLIYLPETSGDQLSIELKCKNCGAKCLVKSNRTVSAGKTDKAGAESFDEATYRKLLDMES